MLNSLARFNVLHSRAQQMGGSPSTQGDHITFDFSFLFS
jgi:hypothetical protein